MASYSAGILLFRPISRDVLLAHPGGPFWVRKDEGAWSIPKGEYLPDESPEAAAAREFQEEVGLPLPEGPLLDLGSQRQKSGKVVTCYAVRADLDLTGAISNTFELEWPPRSGKTQSFPEVDRVEWFDLDTARRKLLVGQQVFLDRLLALTHPG